MRGCISVLLLIIVLAAGVAHGADHALNNDPLARLQVTQHFLNVYNDDKRARVTNRNAPWSTIGKLVNEAGAWCTATLVGRDLILTASHCIHSENGQLVLGHYTFTPEAGNGPTKSAGVTEFWWGSKSYVDGHYNGNDDDWALIRLDTPLGNTFGWMGVQSVPMQNLLNDAIYYMGAYSSDFQGGSVASWERGCKFTGIVGDNLLHDCDMTPGASGAPIFYYQNGQDTSTAYIVGINVAERRNGNPTSLIGIPYSDATSNIAVPASAFYADLIRLKN